MAIRQHLILFSFIFSFYNLSAQMVQDKDTLVGNEWINYGQAYYKFTIEADGIFRIPQATLSAAGISGSATGSEVRIYSMGQQVPLYVSTEDSFGANDYIEFYGYKNRGELDRHLYRKADEDMLNPAHSMYTDARAYYLTLSGTDQPLRVTTLANTIDNPPAPEPYYLHHERIEFNAVGNDPYYPISGGGAISYSSYLHGEGFAKASEANGTTDIQTTNRIPGQDATLHLRFTSTNYGNHQFVIRWNGVILDTIHSYAIRITDITYTIPHALIQDLNQLNISNSNSLSRHALVSAELKYARLTNLNGSTESIINLEDKAGDQYFIFDGFSHNGTPPVVYTTDGQRRMVSDINSNNQVHFRWPENAEQTSLRITYPVTSISGITTLEQKIFVDYTGDDTEYIVITHPALMALGTDSEYIQYRSSPEGGSYRAKAYSILDLYEQFGYGVDKHPQSVRNFVEFFHRHWPSAKMIFMIGRGIEYHRSRYASGTWEPSFFVPTFGRPGADNLLAATLWDLVPRFPIGRLAVVDQHTIQLYLDKVKEHDRSIDSDQTLEDKAWIKNVIHIGGGKAADEQANFAQVLSSLAADISASDFGARVSFFQKESTDIIGESTSKQIEKLLKDGSSIINYLGHSSPNTFEFTINDPAEWNNKGRYPVFSAMGCSAGQIHGTTLSLSDRFVLIKDEGAIAFISGSGSQFPNALVAWARPWYNYFGNLHYGSTLGESILFGLKALTSFINLDNTGSVSYRYLLEQQTFQGDPALKINPLPGPDYLFNPNLVSVKPEILNTNLDSFNVSFSINNIGRNLHQNVNYTIRLRSPGGEETLILSDSVRCVGFENVVSRKLPLPGQLVTGSYRLLITADPFEEIEELPYPQAEQNNRLKDNLGAEGIQIVVLDNLVSAAYPADFAIISSPPAFIATSSNAFLKDLDFVIELDTTPFFNSPTIYREKISGHSGTLKWTPTIDYLDNTEYYWRTSLDSISPDQGYLWSKRTFLFKTGSPPGWNQSHFYQQTENIADSMLPDSQKLSFIYESGVTNFRILNRYQHPSSGGIPFGYVDNVFYTEFFSKFTSNDVHAFVVAVNPVTGSFMLNPNPGLYGSLNNLSYDIRCFPYRTDTPEGRQALINFIQNIIPPEYYVFLYTYQRDAHPDYFPELWAEDEQIFGQSIFSVIESEYPASGIRSLATSGSKPYIVFFQKGKGGLEEFIALDTSEVISLSYDIKSSLGNGRLVSTLIGPSSKWYSIHWSIDDTAADTATLNSISVWALSADLSDTLWISGHLGSRDTSITDIDAALYPYMQLAYASRDTFDYTPQVLDYWRVLYEGYPELIIHPEQGFAFIADTLNRGETMMLSAWIENVSPYDVEDVVVRLQIIGKDNTTEELNTILPDLKRQTGTFAEFEKNTAQLEKEYQLIMEVNPDRVIDELNYTNNIGILPMYVNQDKANPILDVTFDGYHIQDGDIVAAKPSIMIRLFDENDRLRLADTSLFEIYLKYPSDISPKRIYFSQSWVNFLPSPSSGENIAMVELTPFLSEDGFYTLQVNAIDASGNAAGDNDYVVSFEVIQAKAISYIYNFPNPFSSTTRFIYTLTGPGSPHSYKIEIISAAGVKVREITQDDMGPLAAGSHMTSYAWDGTADNGAELPSGVYFFRLVVEDESGKDYPHYQPYGSGSTVNREWGRLVIIR